MDEPHSTQKVPVTSLGVTLKIHQEVPLLETPQMTDEEALNSLNTDQCIELVSLTASLGEQEADRLWARYNIMLTLNGGLLAIASFTHSNKLDVLTLGITLLGLILTFFWYRIVSLSQFYEERWRKDLSAIINGNEALKTLLRARSNFGARINKPICGSSTGHAKCIVLIIGLFWLVFGLWLCTTANPTNKPPVSSQSVTPSPTQIPK